jgi:hypothetical protein
MSALVLVALVHTTGPDPFGIALHAAARVDSQERSYTVSEMGLRAVGADAPGLLALYTFARVALWA